jgi:hypothetical protein
MGIAKLFVLPRKGQADWDEHSSALEQAVQAFYPITRGKWQRCVMYALVRTASHISACEHPIIFRISNLILTLMERILLGVHSSSQKLAACSDSGAKERLAKKKTC